VYEYLLKYFWNISKQWRKILEIEDLLKTKLYDKRDDLNFPIVNFPYIWTWVHLRFLVGFVFDLKFFVWCFVDRCLSFFFWLLCCLSFFLWPLCCLSFFFWPLCCLSFFDLWLLMTHLVSLNFIFTKTTL
jgi:hypothetical protein